MRVASQATCTRRMRCLMSCDNPKLVVTQDSNESLFYHVLAENIEELLPIVHMPTVSQYCQTYGLMFKSLPRSLFISIRDRGAPHPCIRA